MIKLEIPKTIFALAIIGLVDAGIIVGMALSGAISIGLVHL